MRYCILLLLLVVFYSCKKDGKITECYPDGKIKKVYNIVDGKIEGPLIEYSKEGIKGVKYFYKKGDLKDSVINFYEKNIIIRKVFPKNESLAYFKDYNEGKLFSEGFQTKGHKIGIWKFYNYDYSDIYKYHTRVEEYLNLCSKEYVNNVRYYDPNNKLMEDIGNYGDFMYDKISEKKKWININVKYKPLKFPDYMICFSPEIDEDFCNLDNVKLDTVYATDGDYKSNVIKVGFEKSGKKVVRGFISEFDINKVKKNHLSPEKRRLYFSLPLQIK